MRMKETFLLLPLAIDPLIDMVFKILFGTESNKDILLAFLNAVLAHLNIPLAVSVELVPPRNLRRSKEDKETEVDVRARDATGRVFQIEVQLDPGGPLVQRMIYGTGLLYASTLSKGEPYSELKPVVSIWVLRDRIPNNPAPPSPVSEYRVRDADGNVLHEYPVIAVIELQNWIESANFKEELERWLYFFAHGEELSLADDLPPQLQSEVFVKAVKEMKRINDTLEQRLDYNSRMDKIRWKKDLEIIAEAQRKQDQERHEAVEAYTKEVEDRRKEVEARRKEVEVRQKEVEVRNKETEAMRKAIEVRNKEVEARRKAIEARNKETEAMRKAIEARNKETEAMRKAIEVQRQQDEAYRLETEAIRQEAERLQSENNQREANLKTRLETVFRALVESGKSPEEAAKLLGIDPQDSGKEL